VKVLAVDTTTTRASLALLDGDEILAELRIRSDQGHSSRLFPAIEVLLRQVGLAASDLEGFAVTTGPGSFTGLRVGISSVQGLALGSGRPCLGLSALDVLAARIRGTAGTLVAMIDAYRAEVFACLYDRQARPLGPAVLSPPSAVLEGAPPGAAFIGDGVGRYRAEIDAVEGALIPDRSLFLAGTLGRMAAPRLVAGEGHPPEDLRPLYLREADVRKPRP
jgi:tRNA threonylcarbamoyladenosine biosynthesis protein TsaB